MGYVEGAFTQGVNANAECSHNDTFSHVRHWRHDADGNSDAGKIRNLLDFIPGNVALTLTLTLGVRWCRVLKDTR